MRETHEIEQHTKQTAAFILRFIQEKKIWHVEQSRNVLKEKNKKKKPLHQRYGTAQNSQVQFISTSNNPGEAKTW